MSTTTKPVLYALEEVPAGRLVVAVAKILAIDLEIKPINLFEKEQLKPEFVKINPFHCIPTFVDSDGFTIWESAVIATYLIQSRQPDSSLYPKNLKKRATVDKFLHYNVGIFYRALTDVHYAAFQGLDPAPRVIRLKEVVATLESFIAQNAGQFIAGGQELTLADMAIYFNMCYFDLIRFDLAEYPQVKAYKEKVKVALNTFIADGYLDRVQENLLKMFQEYKEKIAEKKD